ncbi:MAG: hypothetical protein WAM69_12585 [Candidatus Sulfotelmatobacter sp.]
MPDIAIDRIEPQETAIFILPGGNRWEESPAPRWTIFSSGLGSVDFAREVIRGLEI